MSASEAPPRVVLLGCGDIGSRLGLELQGRGVPVLGLRRNPDNLPAGLPGQALDYSDATALQKLELGPRDILVFTPKPLAYDAQGYRQGFPVPVQALLSSWEGGPSRRILYISSTRVYAQDDGQWVDESSPALADGFAAQAIIEAENQLLQSPHQVTLLRFAGIYGRWPSRLLQRIERGELCAPEPVRYGNRIHWLDCVGFIDHLLQRLLAGESLSSLYLGVDDAPVSQWEMESWLAQQLGVEPQSTAPISARVANKRCRNRRLQESGYRLLYPDYRAGYGAMLAQRPKAP